MPGGSSDSPACNPDGGAPSRIIEIPALSRVGIRSIPFWKKKPDLWFVQMEAQFLTAGITVDDTRYNYVIQCLDDDSLTEASDIILNPPAMDRYAVLKDRLLRSFADSADKKLRKLLNEVDLGDRRPSQLLRRMRDLAQNGASEEVLKSLWLQRLPQQVQAILASSKHELEELAQLADRITDVLSPSAMAVATVAPTNSNTKDAQISALTEQVTKLVAHLSRDRSRPSHNSRRRSRSKSQPTSKPCWYHQRFGGRALKCTQPCSWKPTASTEKEN